MDKPKLAKLIVKGIASVAVSTLIGYTVKAGKKIDAAIDDHFKTETESDEDN
jgi:nucleoside permease NupC